MDHHNEKREEGLGSTHNRDFHFILYVCIFCLLCPVFKSHDLQKNKRLHKTDGCLIRSRDCGHKSKTCHVRLIPAAPICPQQLDSSIDPLCRPASDLVGSWFPDEEPQGFGPVCLCAAFDTFSVTPTGESRATRRRTRRKKKLMMVKKQIYFQ